MPEGDADFAKSHKSTEHYTPREWWMRVIMVMGEIDFDPASDPGMHIPARRHFTRRENGLVQPWEGRGYLNPPFGHGVGRWFVKLRDEFAKGHTTEMIVLWKAALETRATRTLINIPEYRISLVPDGRISFLYGGDDQHKQDAGDVANFTPIFHYFGPHEEKFIRIFGQHGTLWRPIRKDQNKLVTGDKK